MKADIRVVMTADGSHTIMNETLGKPYHSVYGAWQESQRVYIDVGLQEAFAKFSGDLHVFEMGFGTGLNALLTAREADRHQRRVLYTAIDSDPLPQTEAHQLNYDELLNTSYLLKMHDSLWDESVEISPTFELTKINSSLQNLRISDRFHLIYYDAFAPSSQPELWEPEIFQQMADLLLPGGLLTTYCSKSYVQRNMRAAGLVVEKHDGPHHKRDILRAVKPN